MKKIIVMLLTAGMLASAPSVRAGEDYHLHARDVISISVWGIDDLQLKEITIRGDGKFGFPLLGEIAAAGLTPAELANSLSARLMPFYHKPYVTVNVEKFHTTRIYVLGEVNKPGLYEIDRQHSLLDAIGMAGGYTKEAAKKKVMVISQGSNQPVEVNLLNLLKNGDTSQNRILNEGDVVFLSSNHRLDFNRDILPIISTIYTIKNANED